jgi:2-dehydropantoate 2-reductase
MEDMEMRILVVGAGAVGGYFGGRLSEAGRDVTFLVRSRRAEKIRNDGLRILSPHGDVTLHPKTILAEELATPYDLILLSVKAYALEAAMNDFERAIGPETMILPVLNGMRHIELLTSRFKDRCVIGGVCVVATEVDKDDRIVQLADVQQLTYGEWNGDASERMVALDRTMQGSGFDARLSQNITQEMWEKWVQLSSLGAATCLLRGNIGQIVAIQAGADLCLEILDECRAIATACGFPPGDAFLTRTRAAMTVPGSKLNSSMYRDLIKGNLVEADQILGDLLARGKKREITAPLTEAAFVNLCIYQSHIASS